MKLELPIFQIKMTYFLILRALKSFLCEWFIERHLYLVDVIKPLDTSRRIQTNSTSRLFTAVYSRVWVRVRNIPNDIL